ncbi:MAG: hypothetical protein ACTSXL_00430 [Alphaproteobacteria bacterium]
MIFTLEQGMKRLKEKKLEFKQLENLVDVYKKRLCSIKRVILRQIMKEFICYCYFDTNRIKLNK